MTEEIREAIKNDTFAEYKKDFLEKYQSKSAKKIKNL